MTSFIIAGVIALAVVVLMLALYARFLQARRAVEESWQKVDIALRRRHELVPKFVQAMRPYAGRRKPLLDNVTSLRLTAMALPRLADAQTTAERTLGEGLDQLTALAAATPELRASTEFQALREELDAVEQGIQDARAAYNENVHRFDRLVKTFPTLVIAHMFGFVEAPYFELERSERSLTALLANYGAQTT